MLIATTMTIIGLLAGVIASQIRGLRLGGVIVVPLTAVYLLWDFSTLPVFLMSVVATYLSLRFIKGNLLVFGRPLFLVAVVIGTLVPFIVFALTSSFALTSQISSVEFVLSVLPGVTAYNLHRLSEEKRILDAVWSLTVLLFLTVVGFGFVIAIGLSPLAGYLPPVLLGPTSDVANAFGLTVSRSTMPVLASRPQLISLLTLGIVLSESIRSRYGFRICGVVVIPIIVLMAFRQLWMLPLWIAVSVLSFVGIQLIHWLSLLYGRVLLSMGIIFGLLVSISLVPQLPVDSGLFPYFVGIFGGVTAYNFHVVPPTERLSNVLVVGSVLAAITSITRLFIIPSPDGILTTVESIHVAIGTVLFVPGLVVVYRLERLRPRWQTDRPTRQPTTATEETEAVSD